MSASAKKILVFGEILFDIYPDGTKKPGGAPFNFAYHLANLGIDTYLITRVGNDEDGEEIKKIVSSGPIKSLFIQTDEKLPTGAVTVKLSNKGVPSFSINSPSAYDNINFIEFESTFKKSNIGFDMIYYGTLARREKTSNETLMNIIEANKSSIKFCDINLRKPFYDEVSVMATLGMSDFLKVNEHELAVIVKNELPSDEKKLHNVIKGVAKNFGLSKLCLTMGDKGSLFFDGNEIYKQKAINVEIIDTTGAGDAFSAMMCYCVMNSVKTDEMLKKCNFFASKMCAIKGAVPEISKAKNFYSDFKTTK